MRDTIQKVVAKNGIYIIEISQANNQLTKKTKKVNGQTSKEKD
jgi:hypothetical protein